MTHQTTTAIILAAGEGRRMRPLTARRPKVMLPLAGYPILEHLVVACRNGGIDEIVLIVGYYEEEVRRHFGDGSGFDVRLSYAVQRLPLGTADAVSLVEPLVAGKSFLVLNGDITLGAEDIRRLAAVKVPAMGIVERASVAGLGVVEIADDRVARLHEKVENPPTRLVNSGLYHFDSGIFDFIRITDKSSRGEYEITDVIQRMIDSGRGVGYIFLHDWQDIGDPQALLSANRASLSAMTDADTAGAELEPGVVIKGAVRVGGGSWLRAGTYIEGPVVIGQGCDLGPNCYLRPGTVIGDHCRIGAGVEVKNSVIMDGSRVPHLSYIGDSVIGRNCNIGAGTQVANLRLDGHPADGCHRKVGVIMGDGVVTGINSSINPGTIIGADVVIGPGAVVSGSIKAGSRVF